MQGKMYHFSFKSRGFGFRLRKLNRSCSLGGAAAQEQQQPQAWQQPTRSSRSGAAVASDAAAAKAQQKPSGNSSCGAAAASGVAAASGIVAAQAQAWQQLRRGSATTTALVPPKVTVGGVIWGKGVTSFAQIPRIGPQIEEKMLHLLPNFAGFAAKLGKRCNILDVTPFAQIQRICRQIGEKM